MSGVIVMDPSGLSRMLPSRRYDASLPLWYRTPKSNLKLESLPPRGTLTPVPNTQARVSRAE